MTARRLTTTKEAFLMMVTQLTASIMTTTKDLNEYQRLSEKAKRAELSVSAWIAQYASNQAIAIHDEMDRLHRDGIVNFTDVSPRIEDIDLTGDCSAISGETTLKCGHATLLRGHVTVEHDFNIENSLSTRSGRCSSSLSALLPDSNDTTGNTGAIKELIAFIDAMNVAVTDDTMYNHGKNIYRILGDALAFVKPLR